MSIFHAVIHPAPSQTCHVPHFLAERPGSASLWTLAGCSQSLLIHVSHSSSSVEASRGRNQPGAADRGQTNDPGPPDGVYQDSSSTDGTSRFWFYTTYHWGPISPQLPNHLTTSRQSVFWQACRWQFIKQIGHGVSNPAYTYFSVSCLKHLRILQPEVKQPRCLHSCSSATETAINVEQLMTHVGVHHPESSAFFFQVKRRNTDVWIDLNRRPRG